LSSESAEQETTLNKSIMVVLGMQGITGEKPTLSGKTALFRLDAFGLDGIKIAEPVQYVKYYLL